VFVVRAAKNPQLAPLQRASVSLVKDRYKLLYFFGYPKLGGQERVRLYDLQGDPEELHDLADSYKDISEEMLRKLKATMKEKDLPYLGA